MIGIALCIFAFALTYRLARQSLGAALSSLFAFGYAYGLLRAYVTDVGTHFVFDAALAGVYAGRFSVPTTEEERARSQTARTWALVLAGLPVVCMAYSPILPDSQPLLIQVVGLRDATYALPLLILGARIKREDLDTLAQVVAALNLLALGCAMLEYIYGVEAIVPQSRVTDIVFMAKDVSTLGGNFYRIPSTFVSAHSYGGAMALSLPFVTHGLESGRRTRLLCWAGLGAAAIGTFLCGARLPVVVLAAATIYVLLSLRMRAATIFAFAVSGCGVLYLVTHLERMQRFMTMADSDEITNRLAGSVNMGFFDLLTSYPLGAGLAKAFGTSIPYFLSADALPQVGIENEYGHIAVEEGVLGLALWISFLAIVISRRQQATVTSQAGATYVRALVAATWLSALMGSGALYGVPSASLLLILMGIRIAEPITKPAKQWVRHVGMARRTAPLRPAPSSETARATSARPLAVTRANR
jgi:hypothetical protein